MASCKTITLIVAAIVAAIVVIALIASSLKKIEAHEVGVGYNTVGRQLDSEIKTEGLFGFVPGSQVIIFPNVFQVVSFEDLTCLNRDGASIRLSVTYQFRPRHENITGIILKYRNFDNYKIVLLDEAESELQMVCSLYNTYDIIAKRSEFASTSLQLLEARYNALGSDVSGLQIDNIERPSQYSAALKNKETLREKITVMFNEREKTLIQAETQLQKAHTEAQRQQDSAEHDARLLIIAAHAEAEAVKAELGAEADIYRMLTAAGLSGRSLISYLHADTLATAQHPVMVAIEAPADMSP